jgi:predicted hydrocarbon binding protein
VSVDLVANGMVGLTRDALTALRTVLFRDAGANAATYLQEAGYAGGAALHQAFTRWCGERGYILPENMAAPEFEQRATQFFSELGWGNLTVGVLHDSVMTLDSSDWAESDPASAMQYPGCYLSAGLLADFFGRLAGAQLAVMEVECRSMGAARCRFLLGSAETMQHVYDEMVKGATYDTSLAGMA